MLRLPQATDLILHQSLPIAFFLSPLGRPQVVERVRTLPCKL
jgi:hypothetical protein